MIFAEGSASGNPRVPLAAPLAVHQDRPSGSGHGRPKRRQLSGIPPQRSRVSQRVQKSSGRLPERKPRCSSRAVASGKLAASPFVL